MAAKKRVLKELAEIESDPPPNCGAGPVGDDPFHWQGAIMGPDGTPYEKG